jgi:hypothetical protein
MYSMRKAARTRRSPTFIAPETLHKVAIANRAVLGIAMGRDDERTLEGSRLSLETSRAARATSVTHRDDQNGF